MLNPMGYFQMVPVLGCLHIYESHKSVLCPCGWAHWLNSHHVVKDSGSYCSSSWWACPGPNVTDLLSVDCTWKSMPKLPEIASHLEPYMHSWDSPFNLDHNNWSKVYHPFPVCFGFWVRSPDCQERALNSWALEDRDELWRVKPVKILEMWESCGRWPGKVWKRKTN